ncbi:hypothetical protein F1654_13705 [Alkalicaulis satelles]|uniref:Uncharacterized protein n=1 Tax=Alkalicaulis satelles TaxID=2609175 RepID=A0A5M6ZF70_9PROT|nr:hypothetical protein [Alkalicaulis satelles]KAA5800891.1 hypothetical protein F1654_13705 [Alkalicaulis satelles]
MNRYYFAMMIAAVGGGTVIAMTLLFPSLGSNWRALITALVMGALAFIIESIRQRKRQMKGK